MDEWMEVYKLMFFPFSNEKNEIKRNKMKEEVEEVEEEEEDALLAERLLSIKWKCWWNEWND